MLCSSMALWTIPPSFPFLLTFPVLGLVLCFVLLEAIGRPLGSLPFRSFSSLLVLQLALGAGLIGRRCILVFSTVFKSRCRLCRLDIFIITFSLAIPILRLIYGTWLASLPFTIFISYDRATICSYPSGTISPETSSRVDCFPTGRPPETFRFSQIKEDGSLITLGYFICRE